MALTRPLADDAAVFEFSYTKGNTGVYQLAGAWGGFFTFKSEWPAGAVSIPIRVTDGSANTEISNATYNAGANTLTVIGAPLASTNGGAKVNWSGRTRLLVHALEEGLPLCATPPTVGQVLAWDGREWCPETLGGPGAPVAVVCPTPPTDGEVLVWSAADNAYCPANLCALVAACMMPSFGAVSLGGDAYGWDFPAMSDSSLLSMSVWLYVSNAQNMTTPVGWMFGNASAELFNDPGTGGIENFIAIGGSRSWHGTGTTDTPINDITNITRANPAVITFQNAHGIDAGSYMFAWTPGFANNAAWNGAFPFAPPAALISSVTPTTITVNHDTSAVTAAWVTPSGSNTVGQGGYRLQVVNSMELLVGDSGSTNSALWTWGKQLPPGQWVNVLLGVDTNHAAGSKIANLYFNDVPVPLAALQDVAPAFNMQFSEANAGEGSSWKIGGNYFTAGVICYMAEMWFAPGQFIDFTNSANRAKFHDAMGHPVSLGVDGSLPTGTKPTLYLTQPSAPRASPLKWIDPSGTATSLGSGSAYLEIVSTPLANGITTTSLLTFSFWCDRHTVGDIMDLGNSLVDGNINLYDGLCTVDLKHNTGGGRFLFTFPYSVGAGGNIRVGIDAGHGIGSKIVHAYVNGSAASITVVTDNQNNLVMDWTRVIDFFFTSQGYIGDLWVAPNYFVDPGPYFYSAGAPGALPPTTPSMYFHISGAATADSFATNLGNGGAFHILGGNGHFSLLSPTEFFENATGNGALHSPQFMTTLQLAPVSFP